MSLKNLFLSSYWFSQPYIVRGGLFYVWLGIFGSVLVSGIVLFVVRFYDKDLLRKEVYKRFGTIGLSMGLLGLIWLFLRQERIPFFSWRFWFIPGLFLFAWWIMRAIRFTVKRVPVIRVQQLARAAKDKYLPKK